IRKEIWRNKFFNASTHSRRDLVSLFEHEYSSSDNIYPLHLKPCRRTKQVNGSDRMVTFETNIPETRKNLWATRCGSVCVSSKQTGQQLLQLVQRSESSGNECFTTKLVPVEKSILLPPMESYSRGCSQDLINLSILQPLPLPATSVTEGLENYAIDLILSNKRRIRRRTRYISIQQRFLDWRDLSNIVGPITTPQIVNFLSSLYVKEKLNKSTILSYKSAILRLTSDSKGISNDTLLKEFISAINDSSIKSFVKPTINITPVIEQLKIWGPSETLSDKDLTSKLCWLLAVTGLLRASDIHRIDDSETKIENGVLNLVIVAPKEKRNGQPIKRPCQISGHLNPILCPVKTYQVYKTRIATKECLTQHVNDDSLTINSLPENTTIPKGRSIGATLASKSGVSSDEIVTQSFWSSYSMFDNFYRFSRESNNNLTESILSLNGQKSNILALVAGLLSQKSLKDFGFAFSHKQYKLAKEKAMIGQFELDTGEKIFSQSKTRISEDVVDFFNNILFEKSLPSSKTIVQAQKNGQKTIKEVRMLQDTKKSIYWELKNRFPEIKLSLSKFYFFTREIFKGLQKEQTCAKSSKPEGLDATSCVVIADFKEKFKIGGGPVESNSSFYRKVQISDLCFCIFYKEDGQIFRKYFNYLSENLSHDSFYAINCLKSLLAL
ncbi:hypothetical protein BB560_005327, partial [Smittium megazygosporum]